MKRIKVLLIALILIIGVLICTNTYAEDTYNRHIWAQLDRPFTPIKYTYYAKGDTTGANYVVVKLFNGEHETAGNPKLSKAIYCLRGGEGFGNIDESNGITDEEDCYKVVGEMHTNARTVIDRYKALYKTKPTDANGVNLDREIEVEILNALSDETETKRINLYNALLWILDEAYLPVNAENYNEIEYREELLDKAGIVTDRDKMGKDEIEVIQQLAIWYFVNYDQQEKNVIPTVSQSTMFPAQFLKRGTSNNIDFTRALDKLYQYFIYGAIENASNYIGTDSRTITNNGRVVFDKDNSNIENTTYVVHEPVVTGHTGVRGSLNEYYTIIGPFKLKNNNGDATLKVDANDIVLYDADGNTIKKNHIKYRTETQTVNGEEKEVKIAIGKSRLYEFYSADQFDTISGKKEIKANQTGVSTLETGKDYYIVYYNIFNREFNHNAYYNDEDFYDKFDWIENGLNVSIDETHNISSLNLKISSLYNVSTATFLEGKNGGDDQALVELEKEKVYDEDWLKIEQPKLFDLSLRKFITSITRNGQNITFASREPSIDTTSLINGKTNEKGETEYTATYTHLGTPITVKHGDVVKYKIRIYNEGDIDGRASIVTDYLPDGLELAQNSSINTKYRWTTTDGKTITTDYLKNKGIVIPKFNKTQSDFSATEDVKFQRSTASYGGINNGLYYTELEVECVVAANVGANDKDLINFAEITGYEDNNGNAVTDRDSEPNINIDEYNTTTDSNGNKTNSTYQQDDDDFEPLKLEKIKNGRYSLKLKKEGANGQQLNSTAKFEVDGIQKEVTGTGVVGEKEITSANVATNDVYIIKETQAPVRYERFKSTIKIEVSKKIDGDQYAVDTIKYYVDENNTGNFVEVTSSRDDLTINLDTNVNIELKNYQFDLSLRKFIIKAGDTEYNQENGNSREPVVDTSTLINGRINEKGETEYTATYTHPKNKVVVETGNKVIYKIRVYNEGNLDGTATLVRDYLPEGLEFVPASTSTINRDNGWVIVSQENGKTLVETNKLSETVIGAFEGGTDLHYADLEIECIVTAQITNQDQTLRNIAEIAEDTGDDRDSTPNNVNIDSYNPPVDNSTYQDDDDDFEDLVLLTKKFDLALRKYITKVERNGQNITIPNARDLNNIDASRLYTTNEDTTAEYKHRKDPVEVENNDIVTYKIIIYNEGEIEGRATKVIDQLPAGLKFVRVVSGNYELDSYNEATNKVSFKEKTANSNLAPFNKQTKALDSTALEIECKVEETVVSQEDKILTNIAWISEEYNAESNIVITNQEGEDNDSVPQTAPNKTQEELRTEGNIGYTGKDTHSETELQNNNYFEGQQDDDDFEKIVIKGKPFDLALRKFITSIRRNSEEVMTAEQKEERKPKIDLTTLDNGTFNRNGEMEYTATYEHSKEPLVVKKGDIITYTLRIYNEGARDGYAAEITDYIPEGLALIQNYKTNFDNGWKLEQIENSNVINLIGQNGFYKTEEDAKNFSLADFEDITSLKEVQLVTGKVAITTTTLNDELIKSYGSEVVEGDKWQPEDKEGSTKGLFYQDVEVACLVVAENTYKGVLTNEAEISLDKDENKQDVEDRDSVPDNVINKHEDDDDYEPVVLKYFDLALRKFITNIESAGKSEEVKTRFPDVKIGEDGNIKYEHPKDPLYVANNDVVTYTIRVYNEGTIAGYAEEITDDLPDGLIYLPENETNKKYGWKMYKYIGSVALPQSTNITDKYKFINGKYYEETNDPTEADIVLTDYLSSAQEIAKGRNNLINPFDPSQDISETNPDYRDVQIAFQVTEPNTSDRVLVNSAQISEDSNYDEDSIPGKWNEDEDDQDREYIRVRYFDLSLLKWVTQTIVTVDGKTTTTETGFKPNTGLTETTGIRDNSASEPIAKVEIDKKKIDKTTVKFVYKIRVTNEGELEGYATEITDFIPSGLEFYAEDNKAYGWTKQGDTIVTTRALETKLLKPGESAELTIVFRWKNNSNNLGIKTNIAEITQDYNEHDSSDIDSTPDNLLKPYNKEQEDDDDFALVILSLKTGKTAEYTLFIVSMIAILTTGIYLVKRYVLDY